MMNFIELEGEINSYDLNYIWTFFVFHLAIISWGSTSKVFLIKDKFPLIRTIENK